LPLLKDPALRARAHAFIAATSGELDCPALIVGGVADHVHTVARLGRQISQSDWIKEIKRVSSRWLKAQDRALADFQWQGGYSIFSVSPSNLARVRAYVANQDMHHRRFDFRNELVTLLRRHGLEWDDRHLWD
jgi:REP element-mobilizing transposase RayT